MRDLFLGRTIHDWDVTTSALPAEVLRLYPKAIPTGIKHGTVTVILEDGHGVEVTTYRGEAGYSDGRHPDKVSFVSTLAEDLSRRDLTINAIALDTVRRIVVDPLNGRADLDRQLIRAVGDPLARFTEDGLRPMRAVRFAATLQFKLERDTLAAIPRSIAQFRMVSNERIRDELLKLLEAAAPSVGLNLMIQTGLMAEIFPELMAGERLVQNRHHPEDVLSHSLAVCDLIQGDAILRLAGLLHDVGKPETVRPHPQRRGDSTFHDHQLAGERICKDIARRLRLSNEQQRRLCHLVRHHMFDSEGLTEAGRRRFLRRVGNESLEDLLALRAADLAAKGASPPQQRQLTRFGEQVKDMIRAGVALQRTDLAVDGRRLMAHLGTEPGPHIGEMLAALMERVLEDPTCNEESKLLALAEEWHIDARK